MEIEVTAGIPNAYSQDDRRRFQELVRDGGEVDTAVLQQNVEAARSLVFASSGGKLVGVAALKRPKASYRRKIGKKSGIALSQDEYSYELGYVFVRESARGNGIAHRLVAASLKESDGKAVFGTVRTDNFEPPRDCRRP